MFCNFKRCPFQYSQEMNYIAFFFKMVFQNFGETRKSLIFVTNLQALHSCG